MESYTPTNTEGVGARHQWAGAKAAKAGEVLYMEIERKFLADPTGLDLSVYQKKEMSQGYISTDPVIRIRQSNENYILTVKSGGLLAREEFETMLTAEQYESLSKKVEGILIRKTRYLIPISDADATSDVETETSQPDEMRNLVAELDIFHGDLEGLVYVEVEFPSVEAAKAFQPLPWFGQEVTEDGSYTNAALSRLKPGELKAFLEKTLK